MSWEQIIVDSLKKADVSLISYVPDHSIGKVTKIIEKDNFFHLVPATREEEAIGIAAGMLLAKSPSLVFMQNAGFANSLSTITSLIQLYKFPLIFLIGWRGYLKNDAPEHEKIGKIQLDLLKTMNLDYKIVQNKNWKKMCEWSLKKSENKDSCALVIPREFLD